MGYCEVWIIHKLGNFDRLSSMIAQLDMNLNIDKINLITSENLFELVISYPLTLPDTLDRIGYTLRPLRKAEISVFKKHYYALYEISNYKNCFGFIFEDDVLFTSPTDFQVFWLRVHNTGFLNNYDIIFFGNGSHIEVNDSGVIEPNHTWHKSKCADSYLIKPSAAKDILLDYVMFPPFMPYDWDLSFRINRLNLKVAWIQPGLTCQGSQTGIFKSLIQ